MALQTDQEKMGHVLRRFGLGASVTEIQYYLRNGFEPGIDELLNYENTDEGFKIPITAFVNKKGKVPIPALQLWWILRMMVTRRPLQERMTVFWHNHFATSAEKVKISGMMYQQNELLRSKAVGNFRDLLKSISKDPAMIFWLDLQHNRKGAYNENFAREVMELFTLGVGHYTYQDITESEKAYSGYAYRRDPSTVSSPMPLFEFFLTKRFHDYGPKTFFGKTGNFDGDQILDMICDMPRCHEFITNKLWTWFCYENPEPSVIQKYATIFANNQLEIKPTLKAIMMGDEFYSPKAERTVFKNPCDVCITTARQLGIGADLAQAMSQGGLETTPIQPAGAANQNMNAQGMELLYPPNVSGWHYGRSWISSASLIKRISWGDILFGKSAGTGAQIRLDPTALFSDDPSPLGVAKRLTEIFDAGIPSSKLPLIAEAAKMVCGDQVTEENSAKTAAAACQVLFASPEFQFC